MNYLVLTGEIATSTLVSGAVASTFNFEPLVTALITFGVSIVTLVGGELIKYLIAYFQKKTKDLKEDDADNNGDDKGEK